MNKGMTTHTTTKNTTHENRYTLLRGDNHWSLFKNTRKGPQFQMMVQSSHTDKGAASAVRYAIKRCTGKEMHGFLRSVPSTDFPKGSRYEVWVRTLCA